MRSWLMSEWAAVTAYRRAKRLEFVGKKRGLPYMYVSVIFAKSFLICRERPRKARSLGSEQSGTYTRNYQYHCSDPTAFTYSQIISRTIASFAYTYLPVLLLPAPKRQYYLMTVNDGMSNASNSP
jgi:hypothetical protein